MQVCVNYLPSRVTFRAGFDIRVATTAYAVQVSLFTPDHDEDEAKRYSPNIDLRVVTFCISPAAGHRNCCWSVG